MRTPNEEVVGTVRARFDWQGAADARHGETALGNLVTDAMRAEAGSQLAMINGGAIRDALPASGVTPADRSLRRPEAGYASGPPYDVTVDDVLEVVPHGNRVVTATVTGAKLHELVEAALTGSFLQISGFSLVYDPTANEGARVRSLTRAPGGPEIANDSTSCTLALSDYVYYGGTQYRGLIELSSTIGRTLDALVIDHLIASSREPGTDLDPIVGTRITTR